MRNLLKLSWLFLAAFVIFTSCKDDDDDNGLPPVVVEDGIYIKGAGTALTDLQFEGLMKSAVNEADENSEKAGLFELYVAVEGGSEGFNIVEVAGDKKTTYGPGDDFAEVTGEDLDPEEPQEGLWRGSYSESTTPFTVEEDGLYHIVIDTELGIAAIAYVKHWGLIGGATPGSWSEDTPMEPASFDLNTMTFSVTNAALSVGEFKFRYAGGWKIIIDGENVRVNTNFGGTVTDLEPGASNISNDEAGYYSVDMIWDLTDGYSVVKEKTGEMEKTDWTGVELDLVGNAVSSDNADAIADPSGWGWGNVIYPEPNEPTIDGDIYTWVWDSVILEKENEDGPVGFKVRTKNGEAPVENGANFDSGFGDVDTDNSSGNVVDLDGNISVTTKGAYKVEISINAADSDAKTITITEVE